MRKANAVLSVLLLACAAATSLSCPHAVAAASTEANPVDGDGKLSLLPGFPVPWSAIVPIIGDPVIQGCWRSLLRTESCVTSVFRSILAGRLGLSSECCAAVAALGDYCVPKMFSFLPSGDLINHVCAAFVPPLPPAAAPAGRKPNGKKNPL